MLDTLRATDFTPLLNQSGTMTTPSGLDIPVQVEEVTENPRAMPCRHAPERRIPFSLLLTSPLSAPPLTDGLCRLNLDGLSLSDVYVVRIVPQDESNHLAWYQIVFN
ncbi:hypothetical protein SIID45300_00574 [Candidatus Magnetaquicoccaceae bacterium FCR-1]|uniref:DUF6916 domain-containing protein n=1 Tax=Candidatus Magnetaquiglobus chichijimensis TaxID=3141448 RepID=A0ABQ0C5W8_9PROT